MTKVAPLQARLAAWRTAAAQALALAIGPANQGSPAASYATERLYFDVGPRLRELSLSLVDDCKRAKLDPLTMRRVAQRALHRDDGLAAAIMEARLQVDDLATWTPPTRDSDRQGSLDLQACAAVEMFQDPDGKRFLPGWNVADVAKAIAGPDGQWRAVQASLTGRQRDGSPRCPKFVRLRQKLGKGATRRRYVPKDRNT